MFCIKTNHRNKSQKSYSFLSFTVGSVPYIFTFKCINCVEEIAYLNISNRWNTIKKYYTRLDESKSAMSTLRLAQLGTLTWRPSSLMKTPSHKDKYADNTALCEEISSLHSTCTQRCGGMARPQTTGEQSPIVDNNASKPLSTWYLVVQHLVSAWFQKVYTQFKWVRSFVKLFMKSCNHYSDTISSSIPS